MLDVFRCGNTLVGSKCGIAPLFHGDFNVIYSAEKMIQIFSFGPNFIMTWYGDSFERISILSCHG